MPQPVAVVIVRRSVYDLPLCGGGGGGRVSSSWSAVTFLCRDNLEISRYLHELLYLSCFLHRVYLVPHLPIRPLSKYRRKRPVCWWEAIVVQSLTSPRHWHHL